MKNQDQTLPLQKGIKVYIPKRYVAQGRDWFGNISPERWEYPVNIEIAGKYFGIAESPEAADVAIVFVKSPEGMTGYDLEDLKSGGNGYVPISLQFGPYTAANARDTSLAGGSPFENFTNRSYKGKRVTASNTTDLKIVNETYSLMRGKPVLIVANLSNPMVFSEIEPHSKAILAHFQVQDQAIFELLTGVVEPSALLPMQMPANMQTVEEQFEDVPHDMKVYTDTQGNRYDFGFGLNWSGVINDNRVKKYKK